MVLLWNNMSSAIAVFAATSTAETVRYRRNAATNLVEPKGPVSYSNSPLEPRDCAAVASLRRRKNRHNGVVGVVSIERRACAGCAAVAGSLRPPVKSTITGGEQAVSRLIKAAYNRRGTGGLTS
jgi:hypothetical protein